MGNLGTVYLSCMLISCGSVVIGMVAEKAQVNLPVKMLRVAVWGPVLIMGIIVIYKIISIVFGTMQP